LVNDRILNPEDKSSDDLSLRPDNLTDFIGQKDILENLRVFIEAAKKREASLDHVLLSGPPGLGKTTLAGIVQKKLALI
jgi:Holliday junction DNA helicase RuvB